MSCGCGNKESLIPVIKRKIRKIREIAKEYKIISSNKTKITRINKK